jgi:threonine synthase
MSLIKNNKMKYASTRSSENFVDFKTALLGGLAPDGGLYMPEFIPAFPEGFLDKLSDPSFTFHNMAYDILSPYIGDEIPEEALRVLVKDAFNFPVPITELHGGISLVELFHGPTLAFKDFAARFMARAMSYLVDDGEALTILVATSGDTGGAIAHAYLGLPNIQVKILYPSGAVSHLQEQQLTTMGENITAFEVAGDFDDCQDMVKAAFKDPALKDANLTSANSINIGRLLPQITYYVHAYREFIQSTIKPLICVPSGNFGNLTAGLFAKKMGLPLAKFIAANNRNNPVERYLKTGEYDPVDSVRTPSNAMDVKNPSNFERMRSLYDSVEAMREDVSAFSATDEETLSRIESVYKHDDVIIDPHTAVGIEVVNKFRAATQDESPVLVMSTAHPSKFIETVEPCIHQKIEVPERLAQYGEREKVATKIAPTLEALRAQLLAA